MKNTIQRLRNMKQMSFVHVLMSIICCPAVLTAQNGVTVSGLEMNAGTVTFKVSWQKPMPVDVWSDSVWVFVDYNDAGTMKRLPLSPGATLTETSAPGVGKVIEEENNNKGVWVVGNAKSAANSSGSFSATVQLLTDISTATGACVYASNYPPVGVWDEGSGIVTFTGTPVYDIKLQDSEGQTDDRQSGSPFTLGTYTLLSFTDRTGAPGKVITYTKYCAINPGAIYGEGLPWVDPVCVSFEGGEIRGEDVTIVPGKCVSFEGGEIRGEDVTIVPSHCESFKAGSITGVGIVLPPVLAGLCDMEGGEIYGEGLPWVDPVCVSFEGGEIYGEEDGLEVVPSSCVRFDGGEIRGKDVTIVPSRCESFKAGSITGVSIVGLM